MNTHVDFESSKLLKEKGFNVPCYWYFTHKRKFPTSEDTYYPERTSKPQNWNDDFNLKFYERFSSPTIAEVVMWLYEKHGIWISVDIDVWNTKLCDFTIVGGSDSYDNPYHYESDDKFNSPTEAYQEAINYTLNNLV